MTEEQEMAARQAICQKTIEALKPLTTIGEDDLDSAVVLARMLAVPVGEGVDQQEIGQLVKWARDSLTRATLLLLWLAGALDLTMQKGKVRVRGCSPEKTIQALARWGLALPTDLDAA